LKAKNGVQENACAPVAPLPVIAAAGSGKTNTLADRVAHLIVNGADLEFDRRGRCGTAPARSLMSEQGV
jgi:ATP-dependent exoDNAse (exonuclease V) beta subunit